MNSEQKVSRELARRRNVEQAGGATKCRAVTQKAELCKNKCVSIRIDQIPLLKTLHKPVRQQVLTWLHRHSADYRGQCCNLCSCHWKMVLRELAQDQTVKYWEKGLKYMTLCALTRILLYYQVIDQEFITNFKMLAKCEKVAAQF